MCDVFQYRTPCCMEPVADDKVRVCPHCQKEFDRAICFTPEYHGHDEALDALKEYMPSRYRNQLDHLYQDCLSDLERHTALVRAGMPLFECVKRIEDMFDTVHLLRNVTWRMQADNVERHGQL